MKAVVYSTRSFEREYLAKANHKKHDITLISNALGLDTVAYAAGKKAVIVFSSDDLSAVVIAKLATLKVQYILSRCVEIAYIDVQAAAQYDMRIYKVHVEDPLLHKLMEYPEVLITPQQAKLSIASLEETANQTIMNLDRAGSIYR
jgi:D-lactate dehydrogenase